MRRWFFLTVLCHPHTNLDAYNRDNNSKQFHDTAVHQQDTHTNKLVTVIVNVCSRHISNDTICCIYCLLIIYMFEGFYFIFNFIYMYLKNRSWSLYIFLSTGATYWNTGKSKLAMHVFFFFLFTSACGWRYDTYMIYYVGVISIFFLWVLFAQLQDTIQIMQLLFLSILYIYFFFTNT